MKKSGQMSNSRIPAPRVHRQKTNPDNYKKTFLYKFEIEADERKFMHCCVVVTFLDLTKYRVILLTLILYNSYLLRESKQQNFLQISFLMLIMID